MSSCGACILVLDPTAKTTFKNDQTDLQESVVIEKQIRAFEAAGVNNIYVVTNRRYNSMEGILKRNTNITLCTDELSDSLTEMGQKTIQTVKDLYQQVFICAVNNEAINPDTIRDMIQQKEDVIILESKYKDHKMILINQQVMRWYTIYNGQYTLFGAWKPLYDLREINFTLVHERDKRSEHDASYNAVINWI